MSSPPADAAPDSPTKVGRPSTGRSDSTSLEVALQEACDGEVRFDEYTRVLYATDGSIYQARPAGVVFPRDADDVQAALAVAADHDAAVLPRGAGSSLAGQTVGEDCVVLDCSRHMDTILDTDLENERVTVQPGVVQDHLDSHLAEWDLKFAPDPASSNRATIGGGIGNNSTGAHSVRYGITDAYVEECEAILADGTRIHAREIEVGGSEWDEIVSKDDREAELYRTVRALVEGNADEIEARYPKLKRSVSGYNLHECIYAETQRVSETRAVKPRENANANDSVNVNDNGIETETKDENATQYVNLAKLFVGAEGTLGVVVSATLSLVSLPEETAVVLYCFSDLVDAMEAVPEALEFEPSAVELLDEEVFRLARESSEYAEYAEPIPESARAALMLEFDSELHDDFEEAIGETNAHFVYAGSAFDSIEAYTDAEQADLWKLRKAAIPLLMGMDGDPKPYPFIEDATVPPDELAEYVQGFQGILKAHDTSAAYFAHAGSGTLHIRPILNLKEGEGIEKMQSIAEDVTSLVLDHRGSFSGEHGDGLARTQFNPKMYGPQLWEAFKELKSAFDPDWRMNPGKVVFRDDEPTDMRENLRYGPEYASVEPQTVQDFSDEESFSHLVELCNGCGTCRQTDSDVMCPSYRATKEEVATTRGRANLLRAAISGELPPDEMYTERFQEEVLDLCLGCKGCQSDCPTGVDLAKLKAEVKHQYHEREGASVRSRLFAEFDTLAKVGSKLAPVSNRLSNLPGSDFVAEKLGVSPKRDLPKFAGQSFESWFAARGGPRIPRRDAADTVLLVPDSFTNYVSPEVGRAAVEVLEAAQVHVRVPDAEPSGRPAYSEGFLDTARKRAESNVAQFVPKVRDGWSVVYLEPSDAAMVQDEYRDLVPGEETDLLVANAYGVCEYLNVTRADDRIEFGGTDERVAYHGHCNQKALGTVDHAAAVLDRAGYDVAALDSGCCGMAGSFGYHDEHYGLSQDIADILREQISEADADSVVAPGGSCRSQLSEKSPTHPVEKLATLVH